jgi:hypothetical protein
VSAPEPVAVRAWGELRGDKNLPGVLRILVGGQHAGAVEHYDRRAGVDGEIGLPPAGSWIAQAHGLRRSKPTYHATAEEAVAAVLESSWARRLGARKASRVYWSDKAQRRAARSGGAR